jgi:hypothetical protein
LLHVWNTVLPISNFCDSYVKAGFIYIVISRQVKQWNVLQIKPWVIYGNVFRKVTVFTKTSFIFTVVSSVW